MSFLFPCYSDLMGGLRRIKPFAAAIVSLLVLIGTVSCSAKMGTYENMGYKIDMPTEFSGKVTLLPEKELDDNVIIEVYHTKSMKAEGVSGLLFRIVRHTPAEFEDYWPGIDMVGGSHHFAKSDSYYYSVESATDVPYLVSDSVEFLSLYERLSDVLDSFIAKNGLTEYDHYKTVYEPEYTYPGIHAIFKATLSNESTFTVVLSRPIRQDDTGIWVVERAYDDNGTLYIHMPDTKLTAMEYYELLQSEVDNESDSVLLDAVAVALDYLEVVWDNARHIMTYSIMYI